jgi:hypothetical protein
MVERKSSSGSTTNIFWFPTPKASTSHVASRKFSDARYKRPNCIEQLLCHEIALLGRTISACRRVSFYIFRDSLFFCNCSGIG